MNMKEMKEKRIKLYNKYYYQKNKEKLKQKQKIYYKNKTYPTTIKKNCPNDDSEAQRLDEMTIELIF